MPPRPVIRRARALQNYIEEPMPTFNFVDVPFIPGNPTPCFAPRFPAVTVADTYLDEDLLGIAVDNAGGVFVLTVATWRPPSSNDAALCLAYVTPAGVLRGPIDIHRSPLPASARHKYWAAITPLGASACAVA